VFIQQLRHAANHNGRSFAAGRDDHGADDMILIAGMRRLS
jgi:hypothetical protein